MRTLTVNFSYTINGSEEKNFEFELQEDTTEQDVKEAIAEQQQDEANEQGGDEEGAEYTADMVELTNVSSDEETDGNDTLELIFKFAEYYCQCDQDADVVSAAIACDINPADTDEAYNGTFKDDEDFAQDMAEQLGAIDKNASWPQTCIDWEHAASELMYDYSESNGHYFRNL